MDYWPKFKLVNAIASIDHVGEMASYVRTGTDYQTVINNIKKVNSYGLLNVRSAITSVYSAYNCTGLGDIIIRLFEDEVINDMQQIVFNILVNPDYQMATIIPDSAVQVAIDNTQKGIDYLESKNQDPQKLKSALQWLLDNHSHDPEKWDRFVNHNKRLDKIRKTSFTESYPEYE